MSFQNNIMPSNRFTSVIAEIKSISSTHPNKRTSAKKQDVNTAIDLTGISGSTNLISKFSSPVENQIERGSGARFPRQPQVSFETVAPCTVNREFLQASNKTAEDTKDRNCSKRVLGNGKAKKSSTRGGTQCAGSRRRVASSKKMSTGYKVNLDGKVWAKLDNLSQISGQTPDEFVAELIESIELGFS